MQLPEACYRTSVKALILDEDGRFLLQRESNGKWEMPGGGLDHGESVEDGLRREVMEESGLTITKMAAQPSYFVTKKYKETWKSNVYYVCELENLDITPTEECEGVRFFSVEETDEVELFPIIQEFVKVFDPKNHV